MNVNSSDMCGRTYIMYDIHSLAHAVPISIYCVDLMVAFGIKDGEQVRTGFAG